MIVAAGAGDRQAQEGARRGLDLLVDDIQDELPAVLRIVRLAPQSEESRGDKLLGALAVVSGRQEIAGDLLADKPVVRLVGVE